MTNDVFVAVYDLSGNPLSGIFEASSGAYPSWVPGTFKDSVGNVATTGPAITELTGTGIYKIPRVIVDGKHYVGIVDFGDTASTRMFAYDALDYGTAITEDGSVLTVYDDAGQPLPGLVPTWSTYKNAETGADVLPPVIASLGLGQYRVPFPSDTSIRAVGILDFGSTARPRYFLYDTEGTEEPTPVPAPAQPTFPEMSLATLRYQARLRADRLNSDVFTDTELNGYINSSLAELYDLLVQKYGDNYFVKEPPYSFVTDGVAERFPLPTDFYKLLGVDLSVAGTSPNAWYTLRPFNMQDRNRFIYPNVQVSFGIMSNLRYRVYGKALWLIPRPAAGQTIQIHYVPRITPLVKDSDVADGVSGWLEYVVVDTAIKMLNKEESDVSVLMAQKMGLLQRIESAAENRDAAFPATVTDSSRHGNGAGWGFGDFGEPF